MRYLPLDVKEKPINHSLKLNNSEQASIIFSLTVFFSFPCICFYLQVKLMDILSEIELRLFLNIKAILGTD